MLQVFQADLHVHTCLSPCAEEEMTPLAIVRRAKEKGLNVIAICDHNSTRNVRAVRRAGQQDGLAVIGGVEVTSREEVHILGLFDEQENLEQMQQLIDTNMHGENNPELFGQQYLCDENGFVVGLDTNLLIGATGLSVEQVVDGIHELDGLAIASHVDRERLSLIGQLGFVPEGLDVDALEISRLYSVSEAVGKFPRIGSFPLVRSSDAHRLEEIGVASTTFRAARPSVAELGKALAAEDGRKVMS